MQPWVLLVDVSHLQELMLTCLLQVHAAGKPLPRGGNDKYSEEALLHQTAERTPGYSGAELAGLLNEASILAVLPCILHLSPGQACPALRSCPCRCNAKASVTSR